MMHLKAVVFVRPSMSNMSCSKRNWQTHTTVSYILLKLRAAGFSVANGKSRRARSRLKCAGIYADYYSVNFDTFTLNLPSSVSLALPRDMWGTGQERNFDRAAQGLLALLLSLKLKPQSGIRDRVTSQGNLRARSSKVFWASALFTFRSTEGSQPADSGSKGGPNNTSWHSGLTKLWCTKIESTTIAWYESRPWHTQGSQANSTVTSRWCVLRIEHVQNFGDIGASVKSCWTATKPSWKTTKTYHPSRTCRTLWTSIQNWKQWAPMSINMLPLSELSRLVDQHKMMDVSHLEQELACTDDHSTQLKIAVHDGR